MDSGNSITERQNLDKPCPKLLNGYKLLSTMKIGFAVDRYNEGVGMANVVFNLASQLSDNHDICVLTWEDQCSETLVEMSEKHGIEVEKFSSNSGLRMKIKMREHARKIDNQDLDVINSYGFNMPNAAAISNTPVLKTNLAHTLIKSELLNHPLRLHLWVLEEIPSVYLSDKVVSISKYARNQMKKLYRKDSEIVYIGVDTKTYSSQKTNFKEKYNIDEGKTVFGSLCALRPHKNIRLSIDALSNLDTDDYVYLVGGKGPEEEKLKQRAEDKGVNVRFLGFIDEKELPEFYSGLDLFLFPSLWEGFGVPVLESMACGTPAAVLDQKGPKELVLNEETGYLLPEKTDTWTRKLNEFIDSDKDMRQTSRERAERFSWVKAAEKYEKKLLETAEN